MNLHKNIIINIGTTIIHPLSVPIGVMIGGYMHYSHALVLLFQVNVL